MSKILQVALILALALQPLLLAQNSGAIQGTVTDASGASVLGAVVTATSPDGSQRTTATSGDGTFELSALPPGSYQVKVSANGLSDWTQSSVLVGNAPSAPLTVVMQVAPALTSITVGLSPHEIATEQLRQAEKQRALGIIPNFFVTYDKHPAPLSVKQKLQLGWKTIIDPTTFAAAGITAGIQQQRNSYYQFGQGTEGYFKRFGAQYGNAVSGIFLGGVVMDSIFRQDPRYFYSGEGTRLNRLGYALKASFLVKGDNGRWQLPYADVTGLVAAAELSQTYLPGERTQYSLLGRGLLFHFAGRIALNMGEEFFFKKITSNVPGDRTAENAAPVLREGTPVPLIAVDGLSADGATKGKTVSFVLAKDLTVDGKVVAKTGAVASGQIGTVSAAKSANEASNIGLEQVRLLAGNVNVPLRSSQIRGAPGLMQYKELPDSDKIEVTLYVAENVRFPENP